MFLFIFFIFILITAQNLILLFIRWERVRLISFFLIRWWYRRSEATLIASQAMFYNRLRDFCFLVLIINTFCDVFFYSSSFNINNFNFFFLIIRVFTKSSQFFFHPWLPNAIEGPTPVSSLLHSSTIVVSRVYLLLRVNYFSPFYNLLPVVGRLTILFIRICSAYQSDIKKVIAYSTSSQLGFIIFTIFFISSKHRFFLLFIHAFFKSVLFLVSRLFIHRNNDKQSINQIYIVKTSSSLSNFIFTISAFSLIRLPFLSGFFSKDIIIENLWSSVFNSFIIIVFFVGCIFTVIYSLLLVFIYKFFLSVKNIRQEYISKYMIWLPILFFRAVFFRFFFNSFFFIDEFHFFYIFYFAPVYILFLGRVFFFFLKKNFWRRFRKHAFFYSPLTHSILSKGLININTYVIILDYFFFENIYFFFKNIYYIFFKIFFFFIRYKKIILLIFLSRRFLKIFF